MPQPYKIVVADDEPLIVDAIAEALCHAEYEVLKARNGAEVLLHAHAARPDLILLDLHMPVLDGMRALELLRADPATRGIPVVILSAEAGDDSVARALGAGAAFYLHKPLSLQEIRAIIGRLLSAGDG